MSIPSPEMNEWTPCFRKLFSDRIALVIFLANNEIMHTHVSIIQFCAEHKHGGDHYTELHVAMIHVHQID